jgi:ribulose-5-phosphate 4-epimerase/fuculose-1-phosphate aldolase
VLLERHGAVAVGPDLPTALDVAHSLEHQAQVAWILDCREGGRDPALLMPARLMDAGSEPSPFA